MFLGTIVGRLDLAEQLHRHGLPAGSRDPVVQLVDERSSADHARELGDRLRHPLSREGRRTAACHVPELRHDRMRTPSEEHATSIVTSEGGEHDSIGGICGVCGVTCRSTGWVSEFSRREK